MQNLFVVLQDEKIITEFPDCSDNLTTCKELYQKKLWHQLTDELDKLILSSKCTIDFIRFESSFIRDFHEYMNVLRYGSIIIQIASRSYSEGIINEIQGIAFCEQALNSIENDEKTVVNRNNNKNNNKQLLIDYKQTKLLIKTEIALFELNNTNRVSFDAFKIAKLQLDEILNEINVSIYSLSPLIYSRYHFVCCKLYLKNIDNNQQSYNNPQMYYSNAMSYFAYTPMNKINNLLQWANDIALAALISPNFYDFGELSLHPIIKSLKDTNKEWVLNILNSFISADINSYNNIIKDITNNQQIIKYNINILNQKIQLLSFVRLAFDKSSFQTIISFNEIKNVTQCNDNEIEYLVMKSMSLKLIKGIIDQIDKTVQIVWVKPAILDIKQIQAINNKVHIWINKIQQTQKDIKL